MHSVALLWFALVQALVHAISPALPSAASLHANRSTSATSIARATDSRSDWATASAPLSRHALRLPVRTAAALVTQSSGVVTPDRSDAPPLERAAFYKARFAAHDGLETARARHHRVASRGELLPYFPTAPPHRA